MSAILAFKPGDRVVAIYRFPPAHQPWIHDMHVGVYEGEHPDWKGRSIVHYSFGTQYEQTSELLAIAEARIRFAGALKAAYEQGRLSEHEYDRALQRLARAA